MQSAYQSDLAYIHDTGYGHIARSAAPVVIDALRRSGHQSGLVVELGCGSGISSLLLRDAGFGVVGFDISESMIEMARKRVPDARFHVDSFVTAEIPSCVAVTAMGEVLNYVFDEANDHAARTRLLERVYAALAPGGIFLFDICSPARAPSGKQHRTFSEGSDWAVLVEVQSDGANSRLTRRITTFRKLGDFYRRGCEIHNLQLVDPAEMNERLKRIGFSVQTFDRYGCQSLPRGVTGFLATKPG